MDRDARRLPAGRPALGARRCSDSARSRPTRPPDPAVVGERWREIWLERLDRMSPWILRRLRHQRRDRQWTHGSVCEVLSRIEAAVYAVGGWADGYSNAIPRLFAGLESPCKGLIWPWPRAWPSPEPVTLRFFAGAGELRLPARPANPADGALEDPESPRPGPTAPHRKYRSPDRGRLVEHDHRRGRTVIRSFKDRGRTRLDETGMTIEARGDERYAIAGDDPLSAEHEVRYVIEMSREDWRIRTESRTTMTATAEEFLVTATLDAFEGDVRGRARAWSERIPRDGT